MRQSKAELLGVLVLLAVPQVARAEWSAFHGNAQRDGHTTQVAPVSPTLKWALDLKGPIITSPIVAADGTIYVGATWREELQPRSAIYAIEPSGAIDWVFATEFRDDQVISTPALGPEGQLYVHAADGGLYALSSDGDLLWKHQATSASDSHPVVAPDGTIYMEVDRELLAFSPTGEILWRFDVETDFSPGPSLGLDGTIYAVTGNGVVALSPNGVLKWRSSLGGSVAPPVVSPTGEIIVAGGFSSIYAFDPADGSLAWSSFAAGGPNYGAPAVDDEGNVYFAQDWNLWRINRGGEIAWERTFEDMGRLGSTYSSIAIDGAGNLFLGMGTGKGWAIDIEKQVLVYDRNGTLRGSFPLPDITATSSPAIGPDGTLYVGCLDGKLYALGSS